MRTAMQMNPKTTQARLAYLVLCFLLLAPAAFAASLSFPARHEHLHGSCSGSLLFADDGIHYENAPHAAQWSYADIQQLELLDGGRVRILTYKDSALRLGADRSISFKVDGDLKQTVPLLTGKLDRRLVVGFAETPNPSQKVLASLLVKHLRPFGGDEGTLVFTEEGVSYQSSDKGQSRTWSYDDIENIATSDVFHLSLTTFEHQKLQYASRRVFNFQLKEPLSEDTYNELWRRVNRGQGLKTFEDLRADLEQKAAEAASAPVGAPSFAGPRPPGLQPEADKQWAAENAGAPPFASTGKGWVAQQAKGVSAVKRILREEGLPENFVGVVKVESGFNAMALSPRNARGLWQFIPETARRYGLRVDAKTDERTDLEKSTRAAAHYLKDLYAMFGNWKLALAGYNAGEKRVEAARAAAGTNRFEALSTRLPRETRNYVPAVLAAIGEKAAEGAPSLLVPGRFSPRGYTIFAPVSLLSPGGM